MSLYDFQERVSFLASQYKKWAQKNRVTCYRIYDRDIDGLPYSVDVYEDRLYVCEYLSPKDENESGTEQRRELAEALSECLEIPLPKIYLKARKRQEGKEQYEKVQESGETFVVREGSLKFRVNLQDYLDTGLFLDHRFTRALVGGMSEGMKVLNLFAYTGSFSVYAAAGGAFETVTVDLSQTYLNWAQSNLELNGYTGGFHRMVRRDVFEYLKTETGKKFDIIVLDPPTFSNSKKMDQVLDIQRDYPQLIQRCMKILSPEGTLFFSNNFHKFRMEPKLFPDLTVQDITRITTPKDFRRHPHQSFIVRHGRKNDLTVHSPELQ